MKQTDAMSSYHILLILKLKPELDYFLHEWMRVMLSQVSVSIVTGDPGLLTQKHWHGQHLSHRNDNHLRSDGWNASQKQPTIHWTLYFWGPMYAKSSKPHRKRSIKQCVFKIYSINYQVDQNQPRPDSCPNPTHADHVIVTSIHEKIISSIIP